MTPAESRASLSLAGIFALRMLGLFMILPVLSLYADTLAGATPLLIGVALGAYGLTQALLQVPFGLWSDRVGRKPVITAGLLIFALGSVVAALSHTVYGVIAGRALQGSGAIAAAVMALTADLTREEHRTKAMALIGVSIGLSFAVALVLGPVLNGWVGVSGIFWTTAGLALFGLFVLHVWVPQPAHSQVHRDAEVIPASMHRVLADTQLLRLDFGILALHAILTASFVVVPLALRDVAGLGSEKHWLVYLPVLVFSVAAMVPFIILAEKHRKLKPVFLSAVFVLGLAQLGLAVLHHTVAGIVVSLFVFFTAFNFLEASLPSLVSKVAPSDKKGTAMGVYSSAQFLGAFLGGALGGWGYGAFGFVGVFVGCATLAGIWLALSAGMRKPRYLSSYMLRVGPVDERQAEQLVHSLTRVAGVAEAVVLVEEGVAYLKVDNRTLDEEALRTYSTASAA